MSVRRNSFLVSPTSLMLAGIPKIEQLMPQALKAVVHQALRTSQIGVNTEPAAHAIACGRLSLGVDHRDCLDLLVVSNPALHLTCITRLWTRSIRQTSCLRLDLSSILFARIMREPKVVS